jgi:hypothetical protein
MVRICRAIVGSQMAGHARGRQAIVNVVFVACGALRAGMGAGQLERGRAVIEGCSRPGSRRIVARRTLLRKSRRRMVRVRDAVIVGQMAGHARGRQASVNVVFVARGAQRTGMGAGQWERGGAVIEGCSRPGSRRIVARRTLLRESCRRMVRVRDTVIVGQMAGHARGRQAIVNVVLVARGTQRAGMGAGQGERGRAVIEYCSRPGSR